MKRARAICSLHCFITLHSCDMRMHSFLADQKPVMFSCTLLLLLLLLSLARMMASIGSSCSPTVYTKFITKSDSLFFLFFFTKWSLHRATTFFITKCVPRSYDKHNKVRRLLQSATEQVCIFISCRCRYGYKR